MRTKIELDKKQLKQIIDTIVNFWIEQSFTRKAIQNIGTQSDGFLNVKNSKLQLPSKYQIEIFRRALTDELLNPDYIRRMEYGMMIEIDYDIPSYFKNALLVSGCNPKLMPRKTWISLDHKNIMESGQKFPFYLRASLGYRGEQYYLKPYKLQISWGEKIYNLQKNLKNYRFFQGLKKN